MADLALKKFVLTIVDGNKEMLSNLLNLVNIYYYLAGSFSIILTIIVIYKLW